MEKKRVVRLFDNKGMDEDNAKRSEELVMKLQEAAKNDGKAHLPINIITNEDLDNGRETCACIACRAQDGDFIPPQSIADTVAFLHQTVVAASRFLTGIHKNEELPEGMRDSLVGLMYGFASLHEHFRALELYSEKRVKELVGEENMGKDLTSKLKLLRGMLQDMGDSDPDKH